MILAAFLWLGPRHRPAAPVLVVVNTTVFPSLLLHSLALAIQLGLVGLVLCGLTHGLPRLVGVGRGFTQRKALGDVPVVKTLDVKDLLEVCWVSRSRVVDGDG